MIPKHVSSERNREVEVDSWKNRVENRPSASLGKLDVDSNNMQSLSGFVD